MSQALTSHSNNGFSGRSGEEYLRETISLLSGGKRIIAAWVAIVLLLVALYAFVTKPVYESTARVLVESKVKQGSSTVLDFTGISAAAKLTNEIENLMSYNLAESVACALVRGRFLDGVPGQLVPIITIEGSEEGKLRIAPTPEIADRLLKSVEFAPVRESDIIKVTARSEDPREAALIANTYTQVYREHSLQLSREKTQSIREFLQSQLHAKQRALDSSEATLRGYMQTSGVVDLDEETKKMVEQLAQLEAMRDALDLDIRMKSTTLQSYRDEFARQEPNIAKAMGESNDAYIRMLQEQLARLEVQRDVTLSQIPSGASQGAYPGQLKEVDGQITKLRKNLQERTKDFLSTLTPGDRPSGANEGSAGYLAQLKQHIVEQSIELDGLTAKRVALARVLADYERQFNGIPKRSVDMARLQRSRMSSEKLYLLIDEKFNEAAITEKSDFGYVIIVDAAVVPKRPVGPKILLNLILGLVLGTGIGIGAVLLRAALDVRVRAPEDLKRLGLTVLSVVSHLELELPRRAARKKISGNGEMGDLKQIAHTHGFSPLVESYRHLQTNLQYAQHDKPIKTILFTSVNPGEGKSTTVSNLAIVAAEAGEKVLLVDSDLRRPTLHISFGLPKKPGLSDILLRNKSLMDVVHSDELPGLDILCCGDVPANPASILRSPKLQQVIRTMGEEYDIVLLDTPPLFAVTDAFALTAVVDAVVLVVSAGDAKAPQIEKAIETFGEARMKLLGAVLNKFNPKKTHHGLHGGYGSGYGRYRYPYYSSAEGTPREERGRYGR